MPAQGAEREGGRRRGEARRSDEFWAVDMERVGRGMQEARGVG